MGYRGRLICPLVAEIARLNTDAVGAASGYDKDFRTTKITYPSGTRTVSRVEHTPVQLPCQVEMGAWRAQRMAASGNAPDTRLVLVFHMRNLETASLVDPATGDPLIRIDDRLVSLRKKNGAFLQSVPNPGGLYAVEVANAGMGLGGDRNLILVTFDVRSQGLTSAPG